MHSVTKRVHEITMAHHHWQFGAVDLHTIQPIQIISEIPYKFCIYFFSRVGLYSVLNTKLYIVLANV